VGRIPLRYFRPAAIGLNHPAAGLITLQMLQLCLVDQPELITVIQVPDSTTSLARISSLLAGGSPSIAPGDCLSCDLGLRWLPVPA
jgi:hypothetical protein